MEFEWMQVNVLVQLGSKQWKLLLSKKPVDPWKIHSFEQLDNAKSVVVPSQPLVNHQANWLSLLSLVITRITKSFNPEAAFFVVSWIFKVMLKLLGILYRCCNVVDVALDFFGCHLSKIEHIKEINIKVTLPLDFIDKVHNFVGWCVINRTKICSEGFRFRIGGSIRWPKQLFTDSLVNVDIAILVIDFEAFESK